MPETSPYHQSPRAPHDESQGLIAEGAAQDAAMHRVRDLLERDRVGRQAAAAQRPWWPRILGLLLALGVVGIFALGVDAFLSVFQRMMDTPAVEQKAPPADAPMPVYVVPEEPHAETGRQAAGTGNQPVEPGKPSG